MNHDVHKQSAVGAPRVLLALGKDAANVDRYWIASGAVSEIVRLERATPSGLRFGSRILGLGVDSMAIALKAVMLRKGGRYLAANPWIAVALRLLGVRDLAVTGLYAVPGSRSFKVLRRFLARAVIVTTVQIEADAWVQSGGRALSVLYGNSFGYEKCSATVLDKLTIFIGGTSDRDTAMIKRLENEVLANDHATPVSVVVVANDPPSLVSTSSGTVQHTGYVSAARFGALLSTADIAFLPLAAKGRAAGHMVTVGALEAGLPVLTTASTGMDGYVDGTYVKYVDTDFDILPQAMALATVGMRARADVIGLWQEKFSRAAYVERVASALVELDQKFVRTPGDKS